MGKLWNTLAQCKYTIQEDGHQDWVSCVRFSPNNQNPIIVSAGWDKYVKVWNLANCKLKTNHIGHGGYLNTVTMSPDGSLCASGGKDAKAMLWDLNDGKHLYTLDHQDTINALTFSPNRYWLCATWGPSIKVWDLESKNMVEELRPEVPGSARAEPPQCLSLAWSADGQTLFAGYSDSWLGSGRFPKLGLAKSFCLFPNSCKKTDHCIKSARCTDIRGFLMRTSRLLSPSNLLGLLTLPHMETLLALQSL